MSRKVFFSWGLSLLFFFVTGLLGGQEPFSFRHQPGDQYRILSIVQEDVYINGQFSHSSEILNRIAVEVEAVSSGSGDLRVVYQTSERGGAGDKSFHWASENSARFKRSPLGRYTVSPGLSVPSVRHIPSFPAKALSPGDSWTAPAEEIHDLEPPFGIQKILVLPVEVTYTFTGRETKEGKLYPVLEISYQLINEPGLKGSGLFPQRIEGQFQQKVWWDSEKGRPAYAEESFVYAYLLSSGDVFRFQGTAQGRVEASREMEREELAQEIQKDIDDLGMKGARAESDEGGVKITLEDLLFRPDSAELLPGEEEKLDQIASILKKHSGRDIKITGHGAWVGDENYSQELSEERAAAIGQFLLGRGVRRPDELVIQGKGSREPVGSNSTPEGRRQNRRVEIIILEN